MTDTVDTVGDYIIEAHLGSGSFAKVFLGVHKSQANLESNQMTRYAIKTIALQGEHHQEMINKVIWSEYNAAQKVSHPNLVKYHQFIADATLTTHEDGKQVQEPCALFCMELVEKGDFFNLIMTQDHMDEAMCKYFFK